MRGGRWEAGGRDAACSVRIVFRFPFSLFRLLHARLHTECGGDCREDGDYDVEDFTPGGVVVECSHSD